MGVTFNKRDSTWYVNRWSKNENKNMFNGSHKDEETAAHASDTLARKLKDTGEQGHKLNFPDDDTEVYPEEKKTYSHYIGITCKNSKWHVQRWSKNENRNFYNGSYKSEAKAARASDTLARKLMANGEQGYKLNFPDDDTEVHPEEKKSSSEYIGVSYNKRNWSAKRWSKDAKKAVLRILRK